MADEHAGDPTDLLATLEDKLRRLETELRGSADEVQELAEPAPAPAPRPPLTAVEPHPPPPAVPPAGDAPTLAAARRECDDLRETVDRLAATADELRVLARTVAAEHAGALLRLQRAAAAARRAVDAANRPPGLVPDAALLEPEGR